MTMEKGRIIRWLKKEGDLIKKGEEIVEIETDKVTLKLEASGSGILRKIVAPDKKIVPIGRTIAILAEANEVIDLEAIMKEEAPLEASPMVTMPMAPSAPLKPGERLFASPRAKKLAQEKNVDLRYILGTGPGGRIVEKDVITYLEHPTNLSKQGVKIKEIRSIEGIRKVIADRMFSSLQTAAQLTITMETDVSELERFRNYILPVIEKEENIRVSFTEILVKIVARALEEFPTVNSIIEEDKIKLLDEINIGVAVASDFGLIVPVVHGANKKPLKEISKISKELISKTRSGKLSLDDLSKGTFTITNLGMFGVDIFTPILNPPESGILGVGQILDKWVIKNKEPKVVPTMQLSFTFDHRIIDGHVGAQFLGRIKEIIENYKLLEQTSPVEIKKKITVEEYSERELAADVIIIGGGPGGYTAATRAAQLGLKVIIVEKDKIGGICVNQGCIPTKVMTKTIQLLNTFRNVQERDLGLQFGNIEVNYEKLIKRKNETVKMLSEGIERNLDQAGVQIIKGNAIVKGPRLVEIQSNPIKLLKSKRIILATGLKFEDLPFSKNLYLSNEELLNIKQLPKNMILVGINESSLEYAMIYSEMGVEVTIIGETLDRLHNFDQDLINLLLEMFEMKDIEIISGAKIVDIKAKGDQKEITIQQGSETKKLQADLIVNLREKIPNLENLVADALTLTTQKGRLVTDDYLETNISGIFAVGDIQNQFGLSHTAMYEGTIVAENLFQKKLKANYNAVPRSIFTIPELASVGLTEQQAKNSALTIKMEKRSFGYNAMARIMGEPEGLIKIIADASTNRIYGIHIIGPGATELIAQCAFAIGRNLLDLALNFNQHPTLSEIINECAWQLYIKPA